LSHHEDIEDPNPDVVHDTDSSTGLASEIEDEQVRGEEQRCPAQKPISV